MGLGVDLMGTNMFSGEIKKKHFWGLLIAIFAIIIILFIFISIYINRPVIYNGIKVNGIEAGGMKPEDLEKSIRKSNKGINKDITVKVLDKKYSIAFMDLFNYDYKSAVDKAYGYGREGNIFSRLKDITNARFGKQEINFEVKTVLDEKKATNYIDKIAKDIERPAVNADISMGSNGKFTVTPHQTGYQLDKSSSLKAFKTSNKSVVIKFPVKEIVPDITSQMLEHVNGIIGKYSTGFNSANTNRTQNLRTAADTINGYILIPGREFSLNKVLGPRNKENGYHKAPVIVNGGMEPDYGGGVCQIATTVYNAAVRANLKITERHHHSIPVSYVPLGQDATLSGDVLDLKFKNTLSAPVYIRAYINNSKFYVDIYGDDSRQCFNIDLDSEVKNMKESTTEYREDKNLPAGKNVVERQPHRGYTVNVYKLTYGSDNKLIKRELLHKDTYKSVNRIVRRHSN